MTGQINHVHFDSSVFNGPSNSTVGGTNVYMGRPWRSACNVIGAYGTGTVFLSTAAAPVDIKFTNASTENANQGIITDDVQDITFETHWAEQLNNFLEAQNNSRIYVRDSHIANAGLTGYIARADTCSVIDWDNSPPLGTATSGFYQSGCGSISFGGLMGSYVFNNITWSTGQSGSNINLQTYALPGVYVSCTTSGTSFSGFNGNLAPGALFMFKVNTSSPYPCVLNSTGATSYLWGLNLGNGVSTVSLNAGDTAVFLKTAGPNVGFEYLGKH